MCTVITKMRNLNEQLILQTLNSAREFISSTFPLAYKITFPTVINGLKTGQFKVFLEDISQNDYYKNDEQLKKILDRFTNVDGGAFTMVRRKEDGNPFPQYDFLTDRFELALDHPFPTKHTMLFSIEVDFQDDAQTTFFQFKYQKDQHKYFPLFALEIRDRSVNFRIRTAKGLQRFSLYELPKHRRAKQSFSILYTPSTNTYECFGKAEFPIYPLQSYVRYTEADEGYVKKGGYGEIAFGCYSVVKEKKEESVTFSSIAVYELQ